MPDLQFIAPEVTRTYEFEVDEVYNASCSMCLLNSELDGFDDWVVETRAKLSHEERRSNMVVCELMFSHLIGDERWDGFEAWHRSFQDASAPDLSRRVFERISAKAAALPDSGGRSPSADELMRDRAMYVEIVGTMLKHHGEPLDREFLDYYHALLVAPERLKSVVSAHTEMMWEKYIEAEWRRVAGEIERSVQAFRAIDFGRMPEEDAVKTIIGRDQIPDTIAETLKDAKRIVFIPSAHIGPYLLTIGSAGSIARTMIGARTPSIGSAKPSRSELLARLEALSDATRMQILELAAAGPVTTQDIMTKTGLSQSSASRHLTQLAATGFLNVVSGDRAKRYQLNSERIDRTFEGIRDLFAEQEGL